MFLNRRPIQFRLLFLICMVLAVVLLASTGSSWIGTAAAQTVPSVTPEGTLPPPTPGRQMRRRLARRPVSG